MKCYRAQSFSAFVIVQCVLQANCWADRFKLCMSSKELFKIFILLNLMWVLSTYKQKIVMTLFVSLVAVLLVQYFSKHTLFKRVRI